MSEIFVTREAQRRAENLITQYLRNAGYDGSLEDGTGLYDVVIRPAGTIYSMFRQDLKKAHAYMSLQGAEDVRSALTKDEYDDAVDSILSNWFISRNEGIKPYGYVRVWFSEAMDYWAYSDGDLVATYGGASLIANIKEIYGEDTKAWGSRDFKELVNTTSNALEYYIDVPVTSSEALDITIDADTVLSPNRTDVRLLRATAAAAFSPGTDIESSDHFIERAKDAITTRELITYRAINTVLLDTFPGIINLYTAGHGVAEMIRDVVNFNGVAAHVGNKADIWMASPLVEFVETCPVTVDDDGVAHITLNSSPAHLFSITDDYASEWLVTEGDPDWESNISNYHFVEDSGSGYVDVVQWVYSGEEQESTAAASEDSETVHVDQGIVTTQFLHKDGFEISGNAPADSYNAYSGRLLTGVGKDVSSVFTDSLPATITVGASEPADITVAITGEPVQSSSTAELTVMLEAPVSEDAELSFSLESTAYTVAIEAQASSATFTAVVPDAPDVDVYQDGTLHFFRFFDEAGVLDDYNEDTALPQAYDSENILIARLLRTGNKNIDYTAVVNEFYWLVPGIGAQDIRFTLPTLTDGEKEELGDSTRTVTVRGLTSGTAKEAEEFVFNRANCVASFDPHVKMKTPVVLSFLLNIKSEVDDPTDADKIILQDDVRSSIASYINQIAYTGEPYAQSQLVKYVHQHTSDLARIEMPITCTATMFNMLTGKNETFSVGNTFALPEGTWSKQVTENTVQFYTSADLISVTLI